MNKSKLSILSEVIGFFGMFISIFIVLNTIIGYIIIYFYKLTFLTAIISIVTSLIITTVMTYNIIIKLIYICVKDRNILIFLNYPLIIIIFISLLISLYIYKNALNIWDQANLLSLSFYMILHNEIPQYAPASLDPAFYPIGSSLIISIFSRLFLKNVSAEMVYDKLDIVKYILSEFIKKSTIAIFIYSFLLILDITFIIFGLSLNYISLLKLNKIQVNNKFDYLMLIVTALFISVNMSYVFLYPVNTNAFTGALILITLIFIFSIYNINIKMIIISFILSLGSLLFNYTFAIQIFLYLIILIAFNYLKRYIKSNSKLIMYVILTIIILTIIVNIMVITYIKNIKIISNNYLETWRYLELKRLPYLEIEPGIFGKLYDMHLYVKYKLFRYINFIIIEFIKKVDYTGIVFFIFVIIGIYFYIKNIKINISYLNLLFFILSLITVLLVPLLLFTRIYISMQFLISVYSIIGFYGFINLLYNKFKKLIQLINLILYILLLLSIFMFAKIYIYQYIYQEAQSNLLINIDDIYKISYIIKRINNGTVLLPATPETNILWALTPNKILGCDPRHMLIKTRIYTSIIFDKYYVAIGVYDFTHIPISFKKYIIEKYNITLILQSKNILFSNTTASNLGFTYIGTVGKYKIWLRSGP